MEQKNSRQFFLGANTGAGFVSLYPEFTNPGKGSFFWYIKGGPGNGKSTLMRRAAGTGRIVCPDPVDPKKLAALLLPEEGLSLVAISGDFRFDGKAAQHFRLDAMAELSEAQRKEVRRAAALRRSLTTEACAALRRAKELHDALEARYRPFVDFRALTRFEEKHLEKAFSA